MRRARTAVSAALAWALVVAVGADAAVLCRTRTNVLVVREACKRKETVFPVAPGGQGPAGAPGAQGASGPWPVRLVDADDSDVGPVVYAEWFLSISGPVLLGLPLGFALVSHDALGGAALLGVSIDGVPAGTVYYASGDCTGAPRVAAGDLMPVVQVVGDVVFVPGAPAPATAASKETINFAGGCIGVTPRGGCCQPHAGTFAGVAAEATTTTLDALGITPPLRTVQP